MAVVAHVVVRDVTPEQYDAVRAAAGWLTDTPAGGLGHLTWWEGKDCHNVDAWESEAAFGAFAERQLAPAMAQVGVTSPPETTFHPAHEVFTPRRTVLTEPAAEPIRGDHVTALRRAYDAFAAGDVAAVLASFHPDITWYSPDTIEFGGSYLGVNGVGEFFSHLPEHYEELHVTPVDFVDNGNTVIVLGRHTGRARKGGEIDTPFVHVWTFREGKPVTFTEFFDTVRMNASLGSTASATVSV